MELTKEQIQFIDHRLENEGIKYWDIRIEMLDHVVSDLENKLTSETSEYDFKELVQETFENLGWKENFNSGGFEVVFLRKCKIYAKYSNKGIISEYKKSFSAFKTLRIILLFFLYLFIFRENTTVIKYTMGFGLILFGIAFIFFTSKYKVFNSLRLNRSMIFATFPLSLFNCFMFLPKVFFDYEKLSSTYITAIIALLVPFLIIGINFLYKEFKSAQKIYNKLID
ncbi:hypothetical protein JL193_10170 [Polaribacter batillariae]|uniref:Uncharacterized protein n=1 Tax=Polaribacter batillariae TaxID=2808900 RepID=A0ABX7ST61_9FLAO|nr:hypothetical protein [Polaribacter batillariae]QTD36513.1 hypothetical protein JL193_10170 [Polaribacter batillariae]